MSDGTVPGTKLQDSTVLASKLGSGAARTNFGAGTILQVGWAQKTDVWATSTFTYVDIPGLSVTLTPSSINSKFIVLANINSSSDQYKTYLNIDRNGTTLSLGDGAGDNRNRSTQTSANDQTILNTHGVMLPLEVMLLDSPSTTSPVTYKARGAGRSYTSPAGIMYINRSVPDRQSVEYDDRMASRLIVLEVAG